MFVRQQFMTTLLLIAHITHIDKNKYLIFSKLENIGKQNALFNNC